MKTAALFLLALLVPASAGAVMQDLSDDHGSGEPPARVLTLDEQRSLALERALEAVPATVAPTTAAPDATAAADGPPDAPKPLPPGVVVLFALAGLAVTGAVWIALWSRRRTRAAALAAAAQQGEGSEVESLWRKHLRRDR